MNQEEYEMIKPVRGRESEIEKEPWIFSFANIYPRSFSASILGGYFVYLAGMLAWCGMNYH